VSIKIKIHFLNFRSIKKSAVSLKFQLLYSPPIPQAAAIREEMLASAILGVMVKRRQLPISLLNSDHSTLACALLSYGHPYLKSESV
jgi:hypothetical protein